MANITWSLLLPTAIAIIVVNAIITVLFTYVRGQPTGKKIGMAATLIGSLLVFISLFCLLIMVMYGTPVRFLFEAIDRLINGVVSGLPKMLVFLWFVMPLAIAYLIYAVMAAFYAHKKRKEYQTVDDKNNKPTEKKQKKQRKTRKPRRRIVMKVKERPVTAKLDSLVTQTGIDKAIAFRRFINGSEGLSGTKYQGQYWIVVHNENELEELRSQIPELLGDAMAGSFPAIINATETQATVDTEQHAINEFRKLTRGAR